MRCKNCGTNNDDNRYICEICGSPLYDEEEISDTNDNDGTRAFTPVGDGRSQQTDVQSGNDNQGSNKQPDDYSKSAEKKSIIVIAILAVVLVAIIVSVVLVAQAKKGNVDPSETSSSTSTTESTSNSTTQPTTERTTESTTKETTTESTTKPTTTALKTYSIKLISKGGGTVEGAGTYEDGSNVTIVATPDGDYEFEGWYSNGQKISSSTVYSFTATENISISAVFNEITTAEEKDEETEVLDGGLE